MRIKKRFQSSYTRKASNLRRRQLDLESALLESQFDALELVNPNEAYFDAATGETWLPLGAAGDVDLLAAPFRTESELRLIRQRARITALKNPYAKNLLNSITSFTVGKGHQYTAAVKKNVLKPDRTYAANVARRTQSYIDKLCKSNNWSKRQRQTVWRYHRDGEVFIRMFFDESGMVLFRFIEPAQVSAPNNFKANCSFGIETEPEDVESVTHYWVDGERVPAEEIQHRKANVDMNFKRGLSTLFTIREHLDRALKLLRNMSITVANQTAMSMVRHHKATGKQVQSFAAKTAYASRKNLLTGREVPQANFPPGAVVDVIDGKTRYEFPAGGLNAASPVQVLAAELRAIASAMSWPEFMIGSDSSNANFSSTMVAENPAVKSIETEQTDHINDDLELLYAAVEHAVNVGRLPPEALTMIEIETEAPIIVSRDPKISAETDKILNELKVKSPQSIAAANHLDYTQEQINFTEHDDAAFDDDPLTGPTSGATIPGGDDLAKTALNGAQVTSLVSIIQQAAAGIIPLGSVAAIIAAAFPSLDPATINGIVGPLDGFEPTAAAVAA